MKNDQLMRRLTGKIRVIVKKFWNVKEDGGRKMKKKSLPCGTKRQLKEFNVPVVQKLSIMECPFILNPKNIKITLVSN